MLKILSYYKAEDMNNNELMYFIMTGKFIKMSKITGYNLHKPREVDEYKFFY